MLINCNEHTTAMLCVCIGMNISMYLNALKRHRMLIIVSNNNNNNYPLRSPYQMLLTLVYVLLNKNSNLNLGIYLNISYFYTRCHCQYLGAMLWIQWFTPCIILPHLTDL